MGLQDIANDLKNFDAKNDKVNVSNMNGLPAGEYEVMVENAEHKVYQSGFDCFAVTLNVVTGEHASQKEFINTSFAETSKSGNAIPDFVLERNARMVMKLGALMGVEVSPEVFLLPNETDIHEKLNELLHPEIGKMVHLTIKTRPNKNDPSNPYKEYEFDEPETQIETPEADGTPFSNTDQIDIDDDDLPF